MQKFNCHYKKAVSLKKTSCTDNDVMLNAYVIWKEDKGTDFGLEHAWQLLKDQSKWLEQFIENCSKRTKISTSRAYSSSSNPKTPSPIVRPMGQKAIERKSKGKRVGISTNPMDLISLEEAMRERNVVDTKLVALREKELEKYYYDILMKDTSTMSETQLKDHQTFCKIIHYKPGI